MTSTQKLALSIAALLLLLFILVKFKDLHNQPVHNDTLTQTLSTTTPSLRHPHSDTAHNDTLTQTLTQTLSTTTLLTP